MMEPLLPTDDLELLNSTPLIQTFLHCNILCYCIHITDTV